MTEFVEFTSGNHLYLGFVGAWACVCCIAIGQIAPKLRPVSLLAAGALGFVSYEHILEILHHAFTTIAG